MWFLGAINWVLLWLPNFNTHEQLEPRGSLHTGFPVWSDDGSQIAGVLKKTDDGMLFPPLKGWWGQVNPRYQVVVETPGAGSDLARLGQDVYSHPMSVFYMRSSGYLLVNFIDFYQGGRGFHIHSAENGRVLSRRSADDLGLSGTTWFHAVPSWDGSRIAAFTTEANYVEGGRHISFQVAFVASEGLQVLARHSFEAWMGYNTIQAVWDGSSFTISDMEMAAWRLSEQSPPEQLSEPLECAPFPTASGRVRASDRALVTVGSDGRFKVETESEAELPAELCPGFK